jgi:outer membrane protein assembly factor BamB
VAVRFDWGDGDTSALSAFVAGGAVAADSHPWAVADTFLVRAQAHDVKGALSAWSDPHSVSILTAHPPSTPGVHPFYHSVVACDGLGVVFHLEDSDGDSVAVRIAWSDGDTTDWSEFYSVPRSIQFDHSWRDTGTYLITAKARDVDGLTSDWSAACSVYVWQPKWRYKTGHMVNSSPAIGADGMIYIGSFDDYLYAVNPDGTLRWRYRADGIIWSSPAVGADGTVCFCSEDLNAVPPNGTLSCRYGPLGEIYSSPALTADGTVYVVSEGQCLYAIDPNGMRKWLAWTGGEGRGSSNAGDLHNEPFRLCVWPLPIYM